MSHSTPPSLPTFARWRRARLWSLLLLIPVGVLAGVLSGALMSGLYAWLGPSYQWAIHQRVQSLRLFDIYFVDGKSQLGYWLNDILSGMAQGFKSGVIFSIPFVVSIAVTSRFSCPYRIGLRALFRCVGLWWLVWILCGLNAMLLRYLSPSLLDRLGIGLHVYASDTWFYGAAKGVHVFGIFAVIVGCIWFSFDWREYKREHSL